MKKSIYTRLIALLAGCYVVTNAIAGIPVTPGNLPQKKCGTSRIDTLMQNGLVKPAGPMYSVVEKRLNLGKPLAIGEMVFYASLAEGTKVYRTEKQIEIIDDSLLTSDIKITPADQLSFAGTFQSPKGQKFDLVAVGAGYNKIYTLVDEAGFMCSDRLDRNLIAVGAPTTYQELPLKAVVINPASPRIVSMGLTGATASFQLAVMVNGQLETAKVSSFDVYAPSIAIGDMSFAVKAEEGRLAITSLNEPEDYSIWLMQVRKRR
jgi:hypothetical protein